MIFQESKLAHHYLDGLKGIEIGGSAHNPFGLDTINIDYTMNDTMHRKEQISMCGKVLPVDVVAFGDALPFKDESIDFVISSHVLEHFTNPLKAIDEWFRVVRPGGYVYMIVPDKMRTFDCRRRRTEFKHILTDFMTDSKESHSDAIGGHNHVWTVGDGVEIAQWIQVRSFGRLKLIDSQDMDDKVGNGFTIVMQKDGRDS